MSNDILKKASRTMNKDFIVTFSLLNSPRLIDQFIMRKLWQSLLNLIYHDKISTFIHYFTKTKHANFSFPITFSRI